MWRLNARMRRIGAALRVQRGLDRGRPAGPFDVRPRWPLHELTAA